MARILTKADYVGDCEKCEQYFDLLKQLPLPKERTLELEQLQNHQQIAQHQQIKFKTQRDSLTTNQCLIVQDFGKFYTEEGKISDLVLVFYYRDEQGIVRWQYFDHFSKEKQNFYFVRAVWHRLLSSTQLSSFQEVIIWSDGGPAHFKIAKTLYFFLNIRIVIFKEISIQLLCQLPWSFSL